MSVKAKKPVKKRGRPVATKGQMSTEKIVLKAKELLKEDGKIPSIRQLASALNVDAMAIYHYFDNKNALLEAVTISLIDAIYNPVVSSNWRKELRALCLSYLQLLCDHPGLLETLLSMSSDGPASVFSERFERSLSCLALHDEDQTAALHLLVDYLHGYALAHNWQTEAKLTVGQIDGPLNFYMEALMLKKRNYSAPYKNYLL